MDVWMWVGTSSNEGGTSCGNKMFRCNPEQQRERSAWSSSQRYINGKQHYVDDNEGIPVVMTLDLPIIGREFDSRPRRLVLGWVTFFGWANHLSISPSHPCELSRLPFTSIFPAAPHHNPLSDIKWYGLMTMDVWSTTCPESLGSRDILTASPTPHLLRHYATSTVGLHAG